MKILEAQNALLSNYEVYQHIVDLQRRNKAHKRRAPGNLATLMTEVRHPMQTPLPPLSAEDELTETGPDLPAGEAEPAGEAGANRRLQSRSNPAAPREAPRGKSPERACQGRVALHSKPPAVVQRTAEHGHRRHGGTLHRGGTAENC